MKGILGTKLGMTQVFNESGQVFPVTVIEAGPCVVLQKKTVENDGYEAIQIGFGEQKEQRVNKPSLGHFKKAGSTPKRFVREVRGVNLADYELGQEIKVDIFEAGELIDVVGTSKGKGFQGSIKRHGYSKGPMAHGSRYHRGSGSLGSVKPARVFKGRPLPGHMGSERITVQNLEIVRVDLDRNLLLVKGAVPGPKKGQLIIKKAIKSGK